MWFVGRIPLFGSPFGVLKFGWRGSVAWRASVTWNPWNLFWNPELLHWAFENTSKNGSLCENNNADASDEGFRKGCAEKCKTPGSRNSMRTALGKKLDLRRGLFHRWWFPNTRFRSRQHGKQHCCNTDTTYNNMIVKPHSLKPPPTQVPINAKLRTCWVNV